MLKKNQEELRTNILHKFSYHEISYCTMKSLRREEIAYNMPEIWEPRLRLRRCWIQISQEEGMESNLC